MTGPATRTPRPALPWPSWLAAAPVLLLAAVGVVLPFAWRAFGVIQACLGTGECAVIGALREGGYGTAALNTLGLALLSTAVALPVGLGVAIAMARSERLAPAVSLVASLAANFAGVPLALGLTLILGVNGVVTLGLAALGIAQPVDVASLRGLLVGYVCFQVPLASLLLIPAVRLLEPGVQDAAATLGASPGYFWRRVGVPMLGPSLVETASLLFANAAAAYSTPFAMAGTAADVLPVRIASLVTGDIFADPNLSSLLSLLMFALLAGVLALGRGVATWVRRR